MSNNLLKHAAQVWPGLCQNDLKLILSLVTTYPTGKESEVLADLKDAYQKSDGNFLLALEQAEERLIKQQITR